jgi:hypothetical protein
VIASGNLSGLEESISPTNIHRGEGGFVQGGNQGALPGSNRKGVLIDLA